MKNIDPQLAAIETRKMYDEVSNELDWRKIELTSAAGVRVSKWRDVVWKDKTYSLLLDAYTGLRMARDAFTKLGEM